MQQQTILNNLNKLISMTSNQLSCDSECQKNKKIKELKENLQKAQNNIVTAPYELQNAKNNYYKFILGDSNYKKKLESDYSQKAQDLSNIILNTFYNLNDTAIKKTNESIHLESIFKNIQDFSKQLNQQNKKNILLNTQKIQQNLTNDRKIFYQMQKINYLNYWFYFFCFIYYTLFIFYFYFSQHSLFFSLFVFFIPILVHFISSLVFNWLGIQHYIIVVILFFTSIFFYFYSYLFNFIHYLFNLSFSYFG
uniref:Transmembrane protein n=1 Tax=viral metagenome TaxID=1070528 RepID=A0A6C0H6V6_9ZZZZ